MKQPDQIVVIGDPDAVFGFSLLGLSGVAVADAQTARAAIQKAARQPGVALVLVSEAWAELIRELERERSTSGGPLIIPFPASQPVAAEGGLRGAIQRLLGISLKE